MSALNRKAAGLPETIWDRIDERALEAASDVLTGRRFLPGSGDLWQDNPEPVLGDWL
ncbi:encapsulin [Halochromatium roseum]|uniref:encapsulin n=1 Tax=Halochromatium roseum TaxID=391920 RepID=UPI001A931BF4|nr:encapsulin [Halochromatium roseum]